MTVTCVFGTLGVTKVSLGGFVNNSSAIHCCEAAVFHRVSHPKLRVTNVWAKRGTALRWNYAKQD